VYLAAVDNVGRGKRRRQEVVRVAVPQRIPVRFGDVFPYGAYVLGVEPVSDFDKMKAGVGDVQARDRETGERLWSVRVMDGDPAARTSEVKVKMAAPVQPVPPEPMPGTPFRPVEFEGLTVTPYVDTSRARPRQGLSLRAAGMQPVGSGVSSGRRPGRAAVHDEGRQPGQPAQPNPCGGGPAASSGWMSGRTCTTADTQGSPRPRSPAPPSGNSWRSADTPPHAPR
jgi:hypothetical protein